MNLGQELLEGIINSNIYCCHCLDDTEHHTACVVWSSGAAEQLEAIVTEIWKRYENSLH